MSKPKVVVITGASAGIGRAVVQAFAKEKLHIAIIARDKARLAIVQQEAEAVGAKVLALALDVAQAEKVEEAAALIEAKLGPIDVWINNAMVLVFSPAKSMTAKDYQRVTEVTYLGYVYGTLAALKYMSTRNRGMIIQVGSALAYRAVPLQSAYCAAKHAVQGFTDALRCELMHDKSHIKISIVQLPAMNTPLYSWMKSRMPRRPRPFPLIYQPEVAAKAIVWAACHYRREWYIAEPTVLAIMGYKLMPALGDWFLAKKGYELQQYDGAAERGANNLYQPVEGDPGTHGHFDHLAFTFSPQVWLSRYRRWLCILVLFLFLYLAVTRLT